MTRKRGFSRQRDSAGQFNFHLRLKVVLSFGVGLAAALILPTETHRYLRVLITWDLGGLLFCILFLTSVRGDIKHKKLPAQRHVPARLFFFVLAAIAASLVAVGFMLSDVESITQPQRKVALALSLLAVLNTWLLTNLTFGLWYAYVYLKEMDEKAGPQPIEFAGGANDFWDFFYVAFAVGATFGVTDTGLASSKMRKLVLGHSILAFWYNTAILALALNLITNL
jgi:uncharacterized membrane protein